MKVFKTVGLWRYFEGPANRTCWLAGGGMRNKGDLRMTPKILTCTTEKSGIAF